VRPMVLSGMVSQTIQWVPAGSSKSRSAMRHRNCTGQTTAAKQLRTGRCGKRLWVRGRRSLPDGAGSLADVAVVALAAADAVSPPAQFDDFGAVASRGLYGTRRPHGLVRRPRAPAVEQPAARGGLDGLPGPVRRGAVRRTVRVVPVVARIGRVGHDGGGRWFGL
jgi:hypothetical protein